MLGVSGCVVRGRGCGAGGGVGGGLSQLEDEDALLAVLQGEPLRFDDRVARNHYRVLAGGEGDRLGGRLAADRRAIKGNDRSGVVQLDLKGCLAACGGGEDDADEQQQWHRGPPARATCEARSSPGELPAPLPEGRGPRGKTGGPSAAAGGDFKQRFGRRCRGWLASRPESGGCRSARVRGAGAA